MPNTGCSNPENDKIDILLVDDRADNLTVLEAVLQSPNYNLVRAQSGHEAISLAARTEFSVILLDVQMPSIDGFETAKEIRLRGESRNTPIIFVTAIYADEIYVNMGYEAGAVDYITKPFNPYVLKAKVAVFVELFMKSRQVAGQAKRLMEMEQKEKIREIAALRVQSVQRENAIQKKYIDLVNGINNCIIWSADPFDLRIKFINPQARLLTGFEEKEWLLEPHFWTKQMPIQDVPVFLNALNDARDGRTASFEHRINTKSGKTIWLQTSLQLVPESDFEPSELRGLSVDITSLKNTEEELLSAKNNQSFLAQAGSYLAESLDYNVTLSKIVELAIPRFGTWCVVHMTDENKAVTIVASSHKDPAKFASLKKLEGIRLPILNNLFRVNDCFQKRESIVETRKTSTSDLINELGMRSYVCVPILVREKVLGAITFVSVEKDYTENDLNFFDELSKRAALAIDNALLYREAGKAIQAKDEFLSIASHELRTPLTPLKLQFQTVSKLIKDGKFHTITPEKLAKIMERSDRQLDRLNKLINDLLSISRINLNQLNCEFEQTDLGKIIKGVAEEFKEQLLDSHSDLILNIDASVNAFADAFKIEQVVINLLTNAIKYGQGKPITIDLKNIEGRTQISVKDEGIGIEGKDQERIFELFERAASAQHYGGLGLGLYIVKNIVRGHNGRVLVQSEFGKGSTFTVDLPRQINLTPVLAQPLELAL